MDLAEVFTESARRVLPVARAKGLISYFDYRGPHVDLEVDELRMQSAMHRILVGMIDLMSSGFVMFTADVRHKGDGCELIVNAAGTGAFAADSAVAAVLNRLALGAPQADPFNPLESQAFGRCPATGAELSFVCIKGESMVFNWRLEAPASLLDDEEHMPEAGGAEAWLVSAFDGGLDSVEQRLRRLGWRVRNFCALGDVMSRMTAPQGLRQVPALLLVAESAPTELALLERLAARSLATWIVLGVEAGSLSLVLRGSSSIDVRVLPLSPADLLTFTRHIDFRSSTAHSRLTVPAPLYARSRRRILVVDDNVVNQMVASGLLDVLGYEVEVASNGEEALERCSARPPALALMDLNMPVMDGLQATRQLRSLQTTGDVPPFPVIAATASDEPTARQDCLDVGMDGFLQKPLDIHSLKAAMLRVLPERPAHEGYTVS